MTIKLGVIMDPIASIHYKKDSTLALLWEASQRHWEIFYFEPGDLFLKDGKAYGHAKSLKVFRDDKKWFELGKEKTLDLTELDIILMRKDPPVDLSYFYVTQILDFAVQAGVLVANNPQVLRDANEKIFASQFAECGPPTLISKNMRDLKEFLAEQKEIVAKPLHGMGGESVFYLRYPDINASVVFELLTQREKQFAMVQKFIPEIRSGDKRIILIDGNPVPFALARIPATNELRGNLAAGAKGIAQPLSDRDRWICEQVGPYFRDKGLYFVGIDVIGDYLTEINVTSPTCIRELDEQCDLNISATLLDCLESRLQ